MALGRKFQRVKALLLATYQIGGLGEKKILIMTDLSVGGIRFVADEMIQNGTLVRFHLHLPWIEEPFKLMGEVVRAEKIKESPSFRIAARFIEVQKDEAEEITKATHLIQKAHYIQELSGEEKI